MLHHLFVSIFFVHAFMIFPTSKEDTEMQTNVARWFAKSFTAQGIHWLHPLTNTCLVYCAKLLRSGYLCSNISGINALLASRRNVSFSDFADVTSIKHQHSSPCTQVIVCRASRRALMYKYKGIRWNTEYVRMLGWFFSMTPNLLSPRPWVKVVFWMQLQSLVAHESMAVGHLQRWGICGFCTDGATILEVSLEDKCIRSWIHNIICLSIHITLIYIYYHILYIYYILLYIH